MKFYNRKEELKILGDLFIQARDTSRMTVITGRRRVGKTILALEFARTNKYIYLFVSRKSEHLKFDRSWLALSLDDTKKLLLD